MRVDFNKYTPRMKFESGELVRFGEWTGRIAYPARHTVRKTKIRAAAEYACVELLDGPQGVQHVPEGELIAVTERDVIKAVGPTHDAAAASGAAHDN